jgi:recombination protein RecA
MRTAAELRREVESALAERIPAALSMRPAAVVELVSCGVAEVDAALGGGFPIGAITELTGLDSSGRTTLALSTLAEITQRGESCAYVDVSDAFDPLSAAALGVELQRLLWVRAGGNDAATVSGKQVVQNQSGSQSRAARNPIAQSEAARNPAGQERHADTEPKGRNGGGWCHPRSEALGLDHAISELFHGAQERNTSGELADFTPRCSESIRRPRPEPVSRLHQPQHTGEAGRELWAAPLPTLSTQKRRGEGGAPDSAVASRMAHTARKPWSRLDQSLRAVDLLLNTGGFRAIVLDMGDIDPEHARRVPLALWYRLRLQAEKSQTLLLLLTRGACANSCTAVSLGCESAKADWHQATDASPALLAGLSYGARVTRNTTRGGIQNLTIQKLTDAYGKKPAASARSPQHWQRPLPRHLQSSQATWSSTTSWSG